MIPIKLGPTAFFNAVLGVSAHFKAGTFSGMLLAIILQFSAAADTLTLSKTGDAFSDWKDNKNYYDVNTTKYKYTGGIVLGGGNLSSLWLGRSKPIYRFVIPPRVIASGICELQSVRVLIQGEGENTTLSVGSLELQQKLGDGQTIYIVSTSDFAANTHSPDGQRNYVDLVIDVTGFSANYDLASIKLELTYSGYRQAIANYLACFEAAEAIDEFHDRVATSLDTIQPIGKNVVYEAFAAIRSQIEDLWTEFMPIPIVFDLWDLATLADLMQPLADAVQCGSFYAACPPTRDLRGFSEGAWADLITLAEQWRTYIVQAQENPKPDQVSEFNRKVDQVLDSISYLSVAVQGISECARNARNDLVYGDYATVVYFALSPMILRDNSGAIAPGSYLTVLRERISKMKVAPGPTSIAVSVSQVDPIAPYQTVTISGMAVYDTHQNVNGTATIDTGTRQYTTPVVNGSYGRAVTGPAASGYVTVTVTDGSLANDASTYVNVTGTDQSHGYTFDRTEVCENIDPSYPYMPIDVRKRFSKDDAGFYVWVNLVTLYKSVRVRWEWLSPDGTHDATTYSDWTDDPLDLGEDHWDWWRVWDGWSLKNPSGGYYGDAGREGRWRCKVSVCPEGGSYEHVGTVDFVVRYELVEHRMCADVDASEPWEPKNPKQTFSPTDAKAFTWAKFDLPAEVLEVKWVYYSPEGLYWTVVRLCRLIQFRENNPAAPAGRDFIREEFLEDLAFG